MLNEMSYAAQGALRQEKRFEILSNHLANANTTGFKTQTLSFDNLLQAHMNLDFSQGMMQSTGNPLDLAIEGDGFFKIQTADGVRYTRNGRFSLNNKGALVTGDGNPVLGKTGPITLDSGGEQINETHIQISEEGHISLDGDTLGKLSVVSLSSPEKLTKQGGSLFFYDGPAADEKPPARMSIEQGALEQSNVQATFEMTKMVETSRFYESFQKLMQTIDEMDAKAINDVGQVR